MARDPGREPIPPASAETSAPDEPSSDLVRATGLAGWALWGALVRYLHERGMLPEIGANQIFQEAASELERMSEFDRPELLMARALIDTQFYQWREALRAADPPPAPAAPAVRPAARKVKAKGRAGGPPKGAADG